MRHAASMKVLITGASGFVGGRLRKLLIERGDDVVSLRRSGSPAATTGRSVEGSYDDVASLERIMRDERPEVVLHVAGVTKGVSYADFQRGNVLPTRHLLEALRRAHRNVERFVHVSSLAAYGPSSTDRALVETDPRRPIEHYGRSKLEAERVVERETEIPWTILRPAGVYGPGDVDYLELFRAAARGWNLFYGNRRKWKSVIYVDDCVRAIADASVSDATLRESYFLSDGSPITWEAFQSLMAGAMPRRVRALDIPEAFVDVAARVGELATRFDGKARVFNRQKALMGAQSAWTCSPAKAVADFGFAPSIEPRTGISLTDEWYRSEGWY